MMCVLSVFAADGSDTAFPDILEGFKSFVGISTVVVPAVVGFIASKLSNPMNKWVTMWVTAVIGLVATFFSWWMGLGSRRRCKYMGSFDLTPCSSLWHQLVLLPS